VKRLKRRTEVTIETQRRLIIRAGRKKLTRGWCAGCGRNARMVTVEEAALLSGFTMRQIFRQVEEDRIHFVEAPYGFLICLDSLRELLPQIGGEI